jgi:fumarate reductase (CoM/CoB) subunit B
MAGDGVRGLAQARMTLHADDRPGLRHQIYSCKQCASCREWHWNDPRLPGFEPGVTKEGFVICPVFRHSTGAESDYARGKVKLAQGLVDGHIAASDYVVEKLFQCTQCANCSEHCPQTRVEKLDPAEAIRAARAEPVRQGTALPRAIEVMTHRPPKARPLPRRWISDGVRGQPGAGLAFFPGCVFGHSFKHQTVARRFIALLNRLRAPHQVLTEGWCCGYPAFAAGKTDEAAELARRAAERLQALGVRTLVVSCAWGLRMFRREYPKLLGRALDVGVLHAVEFLAGEVAAGRLDLSRPWKVTATYHDPCQLGRRCGVYEAPRELARAIPGLTLVEMVENRENALCCGGGVSGAYPDLAQDIGATRLAQAEQAGAQVILTACPAGQSNLRLAAAREGSSVAVADLIEAVAAAAGVDG